MEPILFFFTLYLISFFCNFLSALSGGGAGLLQLPALLFLGLPFPLALSTHKIASVALGIGATLRHLRNQTFRGKIVLPVLLFGLPGVFVGSQIALDVEPRLLTLLLGISTILISFLSQSNKYNIIETTNSGEIASKRFILGSCVLLAIGVFNGSLASGSGLFVTYTLVKIFRLSYTEAIATTMVLVGFFWNGTGALMLSLDTKVQWPWLIPLFLGSFTGGYSGAHFGILKGSNYVKKSFEILTLIVGFSLLLKSLP